MTNITKYARIEAGGIAIYRPFTIETLKEMEELIEKYGKIEILEIDQECFRHRLEMADSFVKFQIFFRRQYGRGSDMSAETFNKIEVGMKLLMFDALFGLPM